MVHRGVDVSGDHNEAQRPSTVEKFAESDAVKYFTSKRIYEKIIEVQQKSNFDHPLDKEGELLLMMTHIYKDAWLQGFTARLSGVKDDSST